MDNLQLATYLLLVLVLTITPGADTMLVFRNVIKSGKASGLFTTLGISTGLLIYAIFSAFGISAVLLNSYLLYQLLKTAGFLYLLFIGVQSVLPLIFGKLEKKDRYSVKKEYKKSYVQAYRQGFITNILNPKIIVFYLTILPQFITTQQNVLVNSFLLTGIHIIMGMIWLSFLSFFIGSVKLLYSSLKIRRIIEGLSGLALIAFALLLMFKN